MELKKNITIKICYHYDKEGNRVFDFENMTKQVNNELNQISLCPGYDYEPDEDGHLFKVTCTCMQCIRIEAEEDYQEQIMGSLPDMIQNS